VFFAHIAEEAKREVVLLRRRSARPVEVIRAQRVHGFAGGARRVEGGKEARHGIYDLRLAVGGPERANPK
jgi:hypothetical protein